LRLHTPAGYAATHNTPQEDTAFAIPDSNVILIPTSIPLSAGLDTALQNLTTKARSYEEFNARFLKTLMIEERRRYASDIC
jgi:hypothetical protein